MRILAIEKSWHSANLTLGEKILNKDAKAKLYKRRIENGEGAGSYYGHAWAIFPTKRKTWLTAHNGVFFADFWCYRLTFGVIERTK